MSSDEPLPPDPSRERAAVLDTQRERAHRFRREARIATHQLAAAQGTLARIRSRCTEIAADETAADAERDLADEILRLMTEHDAEEPA